MAKTIALLTRRMGSLHKRRGTDEKRAPTPVPAEEACGDSYESSSNSSYESFPGSARGRSKGIDGADKMRRGLLLLVLATGICSSYLLYGVVQERLFSRSSAHGLAVRSVGPITTFIVLAQCVGNTLVALAWTVLDSKILSRSERSSTAKKKESRQLNHKLLLLTAFCFFGAMACSNESINYISYPTVVLAKSSKLIPAMIAGIVVERRVYSFAEWGGALLITTGIVVFNWTRVSAEAGDQVGDSPFGLYLLALSLAMDGALSACQGALKRDSFAYRPPTAMELMLFTNLYSGLFLLPASLYSGQLKNGAALFAKVGDDAATARNWILLLNATAAAGQVFIFLTIHFFSSIMTTTITTTRKFFSILLSVRAFGHVFSAVQWTSIGMVFGGLYLEIAAKLNARSSVPVVHVAVDLSKKES